MVSFFLLPPHRCHVQQRLIFNDLSSFFLNLFFHFFLELFLSFFLEQIPFPYSSRPVGFCLFSLFLDVFYSLFDNNLFSFYVDYSFVLSFYLFFPFLLFPFLTFSFRNLGVFWGPFFFFFLFPPFFFPSPSSLYCMYVIVLWAYKYGIVSCHDASSIN